MSLPDALAERLKLLQDQLAQVEFFILVWGSGPSQPRQYAKRLQIREHLASRFPSASVFFSEDEEFKALLEQYESDEVVEELEARAVDAVIVLDTSIGPHSELYAFRPVLLAKAFVFTPNEHKDSRGFASTVFHPLKVEGYSPEEFEDCTEIRRKANRFCQALRLEKWRQLRSSPT
jgi:hypothetical protein